MNSIAERSIEADFYHVAGFDKNLKADYVYDPNHHLSEQFSQIREELYYLPERLIYKAMKGVEFGLPLEEVIKESKSYHQTAFLRYFRKGLEILSNQNKEISKTMLIQMKTGYTYMYPYYPMVIDSTGQVRGD